MSTTYNVTVRDNITTITFDDITINASSDILNVIATKDGKKYTAKTNDAETCRQINMLSKNKTSVDLDNRINIEDIIKDPNYWILSHRFAILKLL